MPKRPVNTRARLQRAALEMYAEHGFDGVSVEDIAARADLTERTFYRYFPDKRDALFTPQDEFDAMFLNGDSDNDSDSDSDSDDSIPLGAVLERALLRAAAFFPDGRREWSRARHNVLDADTRFRERELLKLDQLADAITADLIRRGTTPLRARLAAQNAVVVFRIAVDLWIADDTASLPDTIRTTLTELQTLFSQPLAKTQSATSS